MAATASPFAQPRPLTSSFYSTSPALVPLLASNLFSFSLRRKSANIRLFARCCRGSLNTNGYQPPCAIADSSMLLFQLFEEIGLNDKEIDSILNKNPDLRITPFESIRSRTKLLQAAGINGFALSRLVHKQPYILTSKEIATFLLFITNDSDLGLTGQINPSQVEYLLNATEPGFLVGFEKKVRMLIVFGIPIEKVVHVLNQVNLTKALCLKPLEEIDRTLTFMRRFGGVELIIRRPSVLNYDLKTQLLPRIGFLVDLCGGDEDATGTVLRKFPFILAYTVDHLNDHVEFLSSYVGLSREEILRLVLVYPGLFSTSRKRKLQPRIDFLKQCNLSSNDIFKFLKKAPLFLSLSFKGNLANKLTFLVKMGYENRTKELAMAIGAVTRCSCRNVQEVIGVFLDYKLTSKDILEMSMKHPQVLQYNHLSLKEKIEYLVGEMRREVSELLSFPAFLGYKLDSRIKHRYGVKKEVMGEGMSINKLLSKSAARFSNKAGKDEIKMGSCE